MDAKQNEDAAMTSAQPQFATSTALKLPEDLSFEGWIAAAQFTRRSEQGWQWWLCDLLLWADRHEMSERADQALRELKFARSTLEKKRYIGVAFPPSRRREALTFKHHEVVAYRLKEAEADALLDRAIAENWSSAELQKHAQQFKGGRNPHKKRANILAEENLCPGFANSPENESSAKQPKPEPTLAELYRAAAETQQILATLTPALATTSVKVQMAALFAQRALTALIEALHQTSIEA